MSYRAPGAGCHRQQRAAVSVRCRGALCAIAIAVACLFGHDVRADEADKAASDAIGHSLEAQQAPQAAAFEVTLHGERYAPEQARAADTPVLTVPATHRLLIARDGRYRLHTHTSYPGGIAFEFLTVGGMDGESTIDPMQWRDGIEISRDGPDTARQDRADLLALVPALLLEDMQARGKVGPIRESGDGRQEVTFDDLAGRASRLTLDTTNGMPVELVTGNRRFVYSDYRRSHGWTQPARIEQYRDGHPVARWTDVDAEALDAVAPQAFGLPTGYVEAVPRGELRATPLGDGAYRVDGAPAGYHTGFVVGRNAVAVFDTPVSTEAASQVRALIERTAPGKRIAYVVLSHVHGDHVAGLPAYFSDHPQVLAGAHSATALRRQFADLKAVRLTEVDTPRHLDLGGTRIDLYPLDSTHSETMLVGYAPPSRTLFQGDLFYLPEIGQVPAAFEGGEELSRLIARHKLDVEHIVGVHGRSGTPEDLARSLELRQARGTTATAICGDASDPANVVDAQVAAYNAHDIAGFAACYSADVRIHDLSGRYPVRQGQAELKKAYAFLHDVPDAFRVEIVRRIVSGPIVVDHERILGLPEKEGTPEAIAVYEVRDGRITQAWFPPKR